MPTIRSYLKLYQSIGMEKLARFRDMDVDNFRVQLLASYCAAFPASS